MKSLTVQGIEEWLYSDFCLQTNNHLRFIDKFIVHIKLSYNGKMAVSSKYIWFLSWEKQYHNLIDLQQTIILKIYIGTNVVYISSWKHYEAIQSRIKDRKTTQNYTNVFFETFRRVA